MILDSKSAICGARQGIELCIRTFIPALFPFMVITESCGTLLLGVRSKALRKLMKPCKIPCGSEIIYVLGLLGGYPIGAKLISNAYKQNLIKRNDAHRMFMFCCNAGPSFIFGIIGPMFTQPLMPLIIWEIHILSSYLVGVFTAKTEETPCTLIPVSSLNISTIIPTVVKTIGTICGWVVLFRIIITFFTNWLLWCFPTSMQVLFSGTLELSNGCLQLAEIESICERFIIAVIMVTFGGFCVTMQTASLVPLGTLKYYIFGKLYQSIIALFLSIPVVILIANLSLCVLLLPLCCLILFGIRYIVKSSKITVAFLREM